MTTPHHDSPTSLTDPHPSAAEFGPGYEVRDTNVRAVVVFLAGLMLSIVVIQVALWYMLKGMMHNEAPTVAAADVTPPSTFQYPMTSALHEQLNELRVGEAKALGSYGWAGQAGKGPVRVPIARAMDVLAERGVPAVPGKPVTEAMVNSHSGVAQPVDAQGKVRADEATKGQQPQGRPKDGPIDEPKDTPKGQAQGAGRPKP